MKTIASLMFIGMFVVVLPSADAQGVNHGLLGVEEKVADNEGYSTTEENLMEGAYSIPPWDHIRPQEPGGGYRREDGSWVTREDLEEAWGYSTDGKRPRHPNGMSSDDWFNLPNDVNPFGDPLLGDSDEQFPMSHLLPQKPKDLTGSMTGDGVWTEEGWRPNHPKHPNDVDLDGTHGSQHGNPEHLFKKPSALNLLGQFSGDEDGDYDGSFGARRPRKPWGLNGDETHGNPDALFQKPRSLGDGDGHGDIDGTAGDYWGNRPRKPKGLDGDLLHGDPDHLFQKPGSISGYGEHNQDGSYDEFRGRRPKRPGELGFDPDGDGRDSRVNPFGENPFGRNPLREREYEEGTERENPFTRNPFGDQHLDAEGKHPNHPRYPDGSWLSEEDREEGRLPNQPHKPWWSGGGDQDTDANVPNGSFKYPGMPWKDGQPGWWHEPGSFTFPDKPQYGDGGHDGSDGGYDGYPGYRFQVPENPLLKYYIND